MTYRIEISAPTINELSGKLAALASQLKGLPSTFDVLRVEVAEAEEIKAAPPPKPAPVAEPVAEPTPEAKAEEPPAEAGRAYDYNTEVAPRVLELVSKRGRDTVKTLLAGFGVTRASELDASRYGELMDAVNAAMEG